MIGSIAAVLASRREAKQCRARQRVIEVLRAIPPGRYLSAWEIREQAGYRLRYVQPLITTWRKAGLLDIGWVHTPDGDSATYALNDAGREVL